MDSSISGIGIIAYPGPYYTASDSLGNFSIKVPYGNYQVKQVNTVGKGVKISPTCGVSPIGITLSGLNTADSTAQFPNQYAECEILKSHIHRTNIIMPCEGNSETKIAIQNLGLDSVFNVEVAVTYPGLIISPLYSTPTWNSYSSVKSTITFTLPYIAPERTFEAIIFDTVDCSSISPFDQFWFSLKVTPINSCYSEDSIYNYDTVLTEVGYPIKYEDFILGSSDATVFPNPARTLLQVNLGQSNIQHVKIYNISGQLVKHAVASNSSKFLKLNVSDLGEGLYLVHIVDDDNNSTNHKVLIE